MYFNPPSPKIDKKNRNLKLKNNWNWNSFNLIKIGILSNEKSIDWKYFRNFCTYAILYLLCYPFRPSTPLFSQTNTQSHNSTINANWFYKDTSPLHLIFSGLWEVGSFSAVANFKLYVKPPETRLFSIEGNEFMLLRWHLMKFDKTFLMSI